MIISSFSCILSSSNLVFGSSLISLHFSFAYHRTSSSNDLGSWLHATSSTSSMLLLPRACSSKFECLFWSSLLVFPCLSGAFLFIILRIIELTSSSLPLWNIQHCASCSWACFKHRTKLLLKNRIKPIGDYVKLVSEWKRGVSLDNSKTFSLSNRQGHHHAPAVGEHWNLRGRMCGHQWSRITVQAKERRRANHHDQVQYVSIEISSVSPGAKCSSLLPLL